MVLLRTAKTCGPDAPTLASSLRRYPQATVAREPGHRGARRKPLEPLRGESRLNPSEPVATTLVCSSFYTRGRGCSGHPAFPAPSVFGGRTAKARAFYAARTRTHVRQRHCEEPTGPAFGRPDDRLRDEAIHLCCMDRFPEPVIGRAFARPVGSQ